MEKAPAGSLPRSHWPTAALGRVCSSPELRMERHKTFQGMALTWVWSLTPRKPTASQQLTLWKRPKRVNERTLNNSWFKLFSAMFVFLFPPPFVFVRSHLIWFHNTSAGDEIESYILLNVFPTFHFLQSCQGLFCIPTTATNVTYCFAIKISYKSVKNARDPNVRNKRRGYGFRTLLVDILFIFQME